MSMRLRRRATALRNCPLQNRNLNEGYVHSSGQIEPVEENLYLFGGRVDFDHQLEGGDDLITDPAAWNVKMYAHAPRMAGMMM